MILLVDSSDMLGLASVFESTCLLHQTLCYHIYSHITGVSPPVACACMCCCARGRTTARACDSRHITNRHTCSARAQVAVCRTTRLSCKLAGPRRNRNVQETPANTIGGRRSNPWNEHAVRDQSNPSKMLIHSIASSLFWLFSVLRYVLEHALNSI